MQAQYEVTRITVQQIDFVRETRNVQFLKMQVETGDTKSIIFMRGNSIAYGIMVQNSDTGKKYLVLLKRNRIPVTKKRLLEIPACGGMGETACFENPGGAITAVNNAFNDATIKPLLTIDDFTGSNMLYPSPGGCDEAIQFKYATIDASDTKIRTLVNNNTSTVVLVPLENVTQQTTDMKSWIAAYHFMCHSF